MGAGREARGRSWSNIPFVEQGGQPQAVPPGTPGAEVIDLKAGELSVTAVVGKSYATRREETAEAIAAIMQAAPGLAPILAPFWLDELDFPGAKKLAAIAKKTLPPQFQEDEGGRQPSVAAAAAAARAGRADDRAPDEGAEAKTQVIETDQVKADAQVQVTQLELASKERIEARQGAGRAAQGRAVGADRAPADDARRAGRRPTARCSAASRKSVQQLDAQAFQKDQQAAQLQQERDLQQAALAQQGPGPPGRTGAGPGAQGRWARRQAGQQAWLGRRRARRAAATSMDVRRPA